MNRLIYLSTVACLSAAFVTAHAENADSASKHPNACTRSGVGPPKLSASQLEAMFSRPASGADLLRNLKLAFDQDWLLQPAFYDDAILLKFFDGQRVVWKKPDSEVTKDATRDPVEVTITAKAFEGMTVSLLRSCSRVKGYDLPEGHVPPHLRPAGLVELQVASIADVTLSAVRNVFGREMKSYFDYGRGTDGGRYTPTIKGTLLYESPNEGHSPGLGFKKRTAKFLVKRDPEAATRDRPGPLEFSNSDLVKSLSIFVSER
jgi:hypothetical protein